MKRILLWVLVYLLTTILISSSCAKDATQARSTNESTQIATPSSVQTGEVTPILPNVIGSANLSEANAEAAIMKTAANAYFWDKGTFPSTSYDLIPQYSSSVSKAKYYFNIIDGSITEVDSITGGWPGIVFSLSEQKWLKGSPDNNHPNDQDIP
jgi:hypothetical protein